MNYKSTFNFTCIITVILFFAQAKNSIAQIANSFPNDIGIQGDVNVIFTEMGEEPDLTSLFANWTSNSTSNSVALDLTTSPPGSPGNQSIRLFTTGAPSLPAAIRLGYLRKTFPSFTGDTVYIRWYAKYNTTGRFHHSGVWMGGENPISNTVQNIAGHLPTGSDFFMVGAEVKSGPAPCTTSKFDFFNYWPEMRHNSNDTTGTIYYGNNFINDPLVSISMSIWNCFEVRLILNNPVSGHGGEVTMWLNGNQVSDVLLGTLGNWNEDVFTPNMAGTPFEGFQFRDTTALNFDYFQLNHYNDKDTVVGFICSVNYDHIVVAKNYIGPMYDVTGIDKLNNPSDFLIYPNPADDNLYLDLPETEAALNYRISDIQGRTILQSNLLYFDKKINISMLQAGMYFLQIESYPTIVKFIKQ